MPDNNEHLIFFVDDEKSILHFMEYTFKGMENFNVQTFLSGEECLNQLQKNPDLVILDHNMTNNSGNHLNGLDVLRQIKAYSQTTHVIVLSGEKDQEVVQEYMDNGAYKFVTKDSFFIDTLKEEIVHLFNEKV